MALNDISIAGKLAYIENINGQGVEYLNPLAYGVPEVSISEADDFTLSNRHLIDAVSGDYPVTLPEAADSTNGFVSFRVSPGSTGTVTIEGYSGELINGAASIEVVAFDTGILHCDGTEWTMTNGSIVGGGDSNIDGGVADSVYLAEQNYDGGSA